MHGVHRVDRGEEALLLLGEQLGLFRGERLLGRGRPGGDFRKADPRRGKIRKARDV